MAETTKQQIKFLKGQQSSLNALVGAKGIIPGAFYLVEGDVGSHHSDLYYGRSESELHNLNFKIEVVSKISELPDLTGNNGVVGHHFYYAQAENVFAYYDHSIKKWAQINPDTNTFIDDLTAAYANTTNGAKVTITAEVPNPSNPEEPYKPSEDIKFTAGTNITLNADNTNGITINAATYGLSADKTLEKADEPTSKVTEAIIKLNKNNALDSSVKLIPGTAIELSQSDNEITIGVDETAINGISAIELISPERTSDADGKVTNSGGLTLNLYVPSDYENTDEVEPSFSQQIELAVDYGVSEGQKQTSYLSKGKFVLDKVYTQAEIDAKLKGLNGLEYRGIISDQVGLTGLTNIKIGDTWKIASAKAISVKTKDSTGSATKNDLIIANGEEDPNTGFIKSDKLYWDIIEVDNEDTTYLSTITATGFQTVASTDVDKAAFKLDFTNGNDAISVTTAKTNEDDSTAGTVTISHKTATAKLGTQAVSNNDFQLNDGTGAAITQSAEGSKAFKVIDKINFDAFGHIESITTQEVTVVDTNAHLKSLTTTAVDTTDGKGVKATTTAILAHIANLDDDDKKSSVLVYKSKASNVQIKAETATVEVEGDDGTKTSTTEHHVAFDLVWDTF